MASTIPVNFCLDTGATVSLIGKILANKLRKQVGMKSTKIHFDMSIATVDENHKVMISEKCAVDIRIQTKCNKSLVCRGVEFFIADMKMMEVILGNQFLRGLGIDVCRELALIAARTPEWNFENNVPVRSA